MKNNLLIILGLLLITSLISCGDDDEKTFEGYTKVELNGTSKCTSGDAIYGTVKQKKGTIVFYKGNLPMSMNAVGVYIKDENGKYYCACRLPGKYTIDGLEIMFSGIIYKTDQVGGSTGYLLINPLDGAEFGITDLWIKDTHEYLKSEEMPPLSAPNE